MMKKNVATALVAVLALVGAVLAPGLQGARAATQPNSPPSPAAGSYESLQNLFNARCVECHSCSNAPCQLKLTSFAGLQRGASKIEAIHPTRLLAIDPTRLGIDARSAAEWQRDKGFFPVVGDKGGPLLSMINQGQVGSPDDAVADSHTCPMTTEEANAFGSEHSEKLMPYGLPPLTADERSILGNWVSQGHKPPNPEHGPDLTPEQATARDAWLAFLNQQDLEHRLLARYLYEHLFNASVHFSKPSLDYYRLIRSRTPCHEPLDEIATRRPSDDPQGRFQYCFQRAQETTVEKTLLPYALDEAKLARIKAIFFAQPWKVSAWPDYKATASSNPFIIYQNIPVQARYQFLLEDAQYHFSTFIKGPVCYGSGAVSSIDEHFFVFFMQPSADLMVRDPAFAKRSESLLVLPFADESDAAPAGDATIAEMLKTLTERTGFTDKYLASRNDYIRLKYNRVLTTFPHGYQLSDIWDGAGTNPNAVLTVFRHFDSSYVLTGLRGGAATSYFVVDYALFERLVYNLVVGYDVFGSLSHQLHTRVYMGMIRREAEDNFLLFLPPPARKVLRSKWYQGELAKLGEEIFYEPDDSLPPTQISYKGTADTDKELVAKLADHYLAAAVRGPYDGTPHSEYAPLEGLAEKPAASAPFVNMFPDTSVLLVRSDGKLKTAVTIIRDRAHNNLGMMVGESLARVPKEDKLAVVTGLATSYPNLFFVVEEDHLADFSRQLTAVHDRLTAKIFLKKWGVLKTNPQFWTISDALHAYLQKLNPVEYGVLDYTRYGLWSEPDDWH